MTDWKKRVSDEFLRKLFLDVFLQEIKFEVVNIFDVRFIWGFWFNDWVFLFFCGVLGGIIIIIWYIKIVFKI